MAPLPLKDQLKVLEHLQELDLKVTRLEEKKSALPEKLRQLEQNLARVKKTFDAKSALLQEAEKALLQAQGAVDLNRDRMERTSKKLEGVKNTKEFQAASKEVDQLKKLEGTLEEQRVQAQTQVENLKKEIESLKTELEKAQTEHDALASDVSTQMNSLDQDLNVFLDERKQYTKDIETRILSQYDRIRPKRAGVGLVPAISGRCNGCNMMLPPQMFNQLHKTSELIQCPSCFRILYIPESSSRSNA